MSTSTEGILSVEVEGASSDIAAAAEAIIAAGGTVVSVSAAPSADGSALLATIDYRGGEAPDA